MKKLVIAAVAAALLPMSASLQAKTVCLEFFDGIGQLKITVKPIKKLGAYSPIVGRFLDGSTLAAVEGSAVVNVDGTVSLGFQWHSMSMARGQEVLWSADGLDTSLQGIYDFDNNGDGVSDGSSTVTAVSCKTFLF